MPVCEHCQHSNAEGARFCKECGQPLMSAGKGYADAEEASEPQGNWDATDYASEEPVAAPKFGGAAVETFDESAPTWNMCAMVPCISLRLAAGTPSMERVRSPVTGITRFALAPSLAFSASNFFFEPLLTSTYTVACLRLSSSSMIRFWPMKPVPPVMK